MFIQTSVQPHVQDFFREAMRDLKIANLDLRAWLPSLKFLYENRTQLFKLLKTRRLESVASGTMILSITMLLVEFPSSLCPDRFTAAVCLAYYSFDDNLRDDSPFARHAFNRGVMFDPILAQKNFSAVFDGTGYAIVKPFQNVQLGTSFADALSVVFCSFTFLLFNLKELCHCIKRQTTEDSWIHPDRFNAEIARWQSFFCVQQRSEMKIAKCTVLLPAILCRFDRGFVGVHWRTWRHDYSDERHKRHGDTGFVVTAGKVTRVKRRDVFPLWEPKFVCGNKTPVKRDLHPKTMSFPILAITSLPLKKGFQAW